MKTIPRVVFYSSILALAWISSLAFSMRVFGHHANSSTELGAKPLTFPQNAALTLATDSPTLIMLAPSRRSQARASLTELAQVMAQLRGNVKAYVVFANGDDTALWKQALSIPGVVPVGDDDGSETRRFSGDASGKTLVFAQDGQLLFSGDIAHAQGRALPVLCLK